MKAEQSTDKKPTTPEERRARRQHQERVDLVIETYERLLHNYSRPGQLEKCKEMAAEMMAMAAENPEDFGRWKSVVIQVTSPPDPPQP